VLRFFYYLSLIINILIGTLSGAGTMTQFSPPIALILGTLIVMGLFSIYFSSLFTDYQKEKNYILNVSERYETLLQEYVKETKTLSQSMTYNESDSFFSKVREFTDSIPVFSTVMNVFDIVFNAITIIFQTLFTKINAIKAFLGMAAETFIYELPALAPILSVLIAFFSTYMVFTMFQSRVTKRV